MTPGWRYLRVAPAAGWLLLTLLRPGRRARLLREDAVWSSRARLPGARLLRLRLACAQRVVSRSAPILAGRGGRRLLGRGLAVYYLCDVPSRLRASASRDARRRRGEHDARHRLADAAWSAGRGGGTTPTRRSAAPTRRTGRCTSPGCCWSRSCSWRAAAASARGGPGCSSASYARCRVRAGADQPGARLRRRCRARVPLPDRCGAGGRAVPGTGLPRGRGAVGVGSAPREPVLRAAPAPTLAGGRSCALVLVGGAGQLGRSTRTSGTTTTRATTTRSLQASLRDRPGRRSTSPTQVVPDTVDARLLGAIQHHRAAAAPAGRQRPLPRRRRDGWSCWPTTAVAPRADRAGHREPAGPGPELRLAGPGGRSPSRWRARPSTSRGGSGSATSARSDRHHDGRRAGDRAHRAGAARGCRACSSSVTGAFTIVTLGGLSAGHHRLRRDRRGRATRCREEHCERPRAHSDLGDAVVPPPPETAPTFPLLDTMRAVGALCVLTTHAAFWAGDYTRHGTWGTVLARLDVGVAIFFVLSGFLLSRPWLPARRPTGRPRRGRAATSGSARCGSPRLRRRPSCSR